MDLRANLEEPVVLPPLGRKLIPTGLFIELPAGYEAQIRPRSGLSIKKGITVLNSPGTIDADYRGEICVILVNLSDEDFVVNDGERVCQMVIARHGNYRTVYANLTDIYVSVGQKVSARQSIGKIFTDSDNDNKTELYFQIWEGKKLLNPETWISR